MSLEELSMGNLLGFCDDGLSGPDFSTVPALGEDTSSSSLTGPPSGYYAKLLNNQAEIKGSIMELTRLVSDMRATQQSMLTTMSNLTQSVKELRDASNNVHASNIKAGAFEVELESSAQNTRQMSSSAPAALIRGAWFDVYPRDEFPVSFKHHSLNKN